MTTTKNITNVEIGGLNTDDYPDFADAYFESATVNGVPLTDEELDELSEDGEFLNEQIINYLF